MSDDDILQLSFFQVIPDFDQLSRNGATCSISNLNKALPALGREPHEVDDFILRGPEVEYEGYIDIRPSVIIQTAMELGMVTAEENAALVYDRDSLFEDLRSSQAEAAALQQELDALRAAIRGSFLTDDTPSEDVLDTDYLPLPEDL